MSKTIMGNMIGSYSQLGRTFSFVDEDGSEVVGVITDKEQIFTATDNDVREGFVYASDAGVSTGSKVIPPYYVSCGFKIVPSGQSATISVPEYNYQNLLITITSYNTSWSKSTMLTYVSIDNSIYTIDDNSKVADIVIDGDNCLIDLGIVVNEKSVLRYFVVSEDI